jgi:hypothetical protein
MSKAKQKVNHTNPGKKEEYHGKQLGHSRSEGNPDVSQFQGTDNRVKPHETTGPDVGATFHSQAPSLAGASPNRVRHAEPKRIVEHGTSRLSNVHNAPKTESGPTRAEVDADKVALFSRGGSGNSDAIPRPGMSPRDWNSTDSPAPNREKR